MARAMPTRTPCSSLRVDAITTSSSADYLGGDPEDAHERDGKRAYGADQGHDARLLSKHNQHRLRVKLELCAKSTIQRAVRLLNHGLL